MAYFAEFFEFGAKVFVKKFSGAKNDAAHWCWNFNFFRLFIGFRVPMLVAVMAGVFSGYIFRCLGHQLAQTMMSGMGRFVLIALPLFVLAGGLMNAAAFLADYLILRGHWWVRYGEVLRMLML